MRSFVLHTRDGTTSFQEAEPGSSDHRNRCKFCIALRPQRRSSSRLSLRSGLRRSFRSVFTTVAVSTRLGTDLTRGVVVPVGLRGRDRGRVGPGSALTLPRRAEERRGRTLGSRGRDSTLDDSHLSPVGTVSLPEPSYRRRENTTPSVFSTFNQTPSPLMA